MSRKLFLDQHLKAVLWTGMKQTLGRKINSLPVDRAVADDRKTLI